MENKETLYDYALPVHQALLHPIQLFGIGDTAFMIILMTTTFLATLVSAWCIIIGLIALFIVKQLCKNEPYLVDFIIENLSQSDIYIG